MTKYIHGIPKMVLLGHPTTQYTIYNRNDTEVVLLVHPTI